MQLTRYVFGGHQDNPPGNWWKCCASAEHYLAHQFCFGADREVEAGKCECIRKRQFVID